MARKRRTRRGRFQAIPFNAELALATLANDTLLKISMLGGTFVEDFYCISVDALWSIKDLTAGEVPIEVGFNHGDLIATEVVEALDANLLDPSDIIQRERARRPVRRVGKFTDGAKTDMEIGDGVLIRTPLKFMVNDGHAIQAWAINRTGATLTTGALLNISGTLYGRWSN